MKAIGGYIELQLSNGVEYYQDLIALNTGRNAFEYILKARGYTLIHLPFFCTDVILEPLRRLNIQWQFYNIDDNLDPVLDFNVGPTEAMFYINYFGLKQETVTNLTKRIQNLVVDNCQAFFSPPLGADTFYSCRKFFGVSDGSYLYTSTPVRMKLEKDTSAERIPALVKAIDASTDVAREEFVKNELVISNKAIKRMSDLTHRLMTSADYKYCQYRRNSNFMYLHETLMDVNDLAIDTAQITSPMVYPFLHASSKIKEKLKANNILVDTYWPNVFNWTTRQMYEYYLSAHLFCLPIDHRYKHADMKRIINVLKPLI